MTLPDLVLPRDLPLWREARAYLDVRDNDEHTLVAYGLARAIVAETPGAEASVVLPAILLHDVGWKRIDPALLLAAVGRNPTRPDLVRAHELHGVEIAREILQRHRPKGVDIDAVLAIIDGHDTDKTARSVNDACVKDADKTWRVTPHGIATIGGWYDVGPAEVIDMLNEMSVPLMLTKAGRAMTAGFLAAAQAGLALPRYMKVPMDA